MSSGSSEGCQQNPMLLGWCGGNYSACPRYPAWSRSERAWNGLHLFSMNIYMVISYIMYQHMLRTKSTHTHAGKNAHKLSNQENINTHAHTHTNSFYIRWKLKNLNVSPWMNELTQKTIKKAARRQSTFVCFVLDKMSGHCLGKCIDLAKRTVNIALTVVQEERNLRCRGRQSRVK